MDPKNKYRGWDLWIEGDGSASHLINAFPEDALKVVGNERRCRSTSGPTSRSPTTARRRPPGVTIYVNGQLQATDDAVRHAQVHDEDRGAAHDRHAARHGAARRTPLIEDVRLYDRALTPVGGRATRSLRRRGRCARQARRQAHRRRRQTTAFDWWLGDVRRADRATSAARSSSSRPRRRRSSARGTIAHVMNEKTGEPAAYILYPRRLRQAPRSGEGRDARSRCRRCRRTCRATASAWRSGCWRRITR